MNEKESANWRSGAIFGFYVSVLILAASQFYEFFYEGQLFSITSIFWIGLLAAFGCYFILNYRDERKKK